MIVEIDGVFTQETLKKDTDPVAGQTEKKTYHLVRQRFLVQG
jgi:hypothetical protein